MSKGLEALKRLGWYQRIDGMCALQSNDYKIVEDELKALEIIKKKGNFISLEYDEFNGKYYIYDSELYMHNEITKEEYDLLKEILL